MSDWDCGREINIKQRKPHVELLISLTARHLYITRTLEIGSNELWWIVDSKLLKYFSISPREVKTPTNLCSSWHGLDSDKIICYRSYMKNASATWLLQFHQYKYVSYIYLFIYIRFGFLIHYCLYLYISLEHLNIICISNWMFEVLFLIYFLTLSKELCIYNNVRECVN